MAPYEKTFITQVAQVEDLFWKNLQGRLDHASLHDQTCRIKHHCQIIHQCRITNRCMIIHHCVIIVGLQLHQCRIIKHCRIIHQCRIINQCGIIATSMQDHTSLWDYTSMCHHPSLSVMNVINCFDNGNRYTYVGSSGSQLIICSGFNVIVELRPKGVKKINLVWSQVYTSAFHIATKQSSLLPMKEIYQAQVERHQAAELFFETFAVEVHIA